MYFYFKPEVELQISVARPLVSEQDLQACNLMSVTVESLFSPPDSLTQSVPGATISSYSAAMPISFAANVRFLSVNFSLNLYFCIFLLIKYFNAFKKFLLLKERLKRFWGGESRSTRRLGHLVAALMVLDAKFSRCWTSFQILSKIAIESCNL